MRERISSQSSEIDDNPVLFHQVDLNFAKHIKLYMENDENHVEKLFINITIEQKYFVSRNMCFLACTQILWTPSTVHTYTTPAVGFS